MSSRSVWSIELVLRQQGVNKETLAGGREREREGWREGDRQG